MNLFLVSNFLPAWSNHMMKIDRELIMHIMSVDNFSNHSEDSIKHGLSSTQQTKSLIIIILLTHSNMPSKLLNGPVRAMFSHFTLWLSSGYEPIHSSLYQTIIITANMSHSFTHNQMTTLWLFLLLGSSALLLPWSSVPCSMISEFKSCNVSPLHRFFMTQLLTKFCKKVCN